MLITFILFIYYYSLQVEDVYTEFIVSFCKAKRAAILKGSMVMLRADGFGQYLIPLGITHVVTSFMLLITNILLFLLLICL